MSYDQLFWLHIKKSAGETTRKLLKPYYVEVDRIKRPKTFVQATTEEYNDILNNHRVVLGDLQFRRCLFAKTYLFQNCWDRHFSFAFAREPTERCVSMFHYLFWSHTGVAERLVSSFRIYANVKKFCFNASYAFDVFLDCVESARVSDSIFWPMNLHFTTHTAPMWEDVTDLNGNNLIACVFRLENLVAGVNRAFEECGIDKRVERDHKQLNVNNARVRYRPSRAQRDRITNIYANDFDLYERAGRESRGVGDATRTSELCVASPE